jgi:hypothetical protein
MLEVLPSPDHVVALRASGRLDENDIEGAIQAVEAALARQDRIAVLAEIDVTGMSPGALARDLGYGLGKIRELYRFPRAAVVTGQEWVRWIARIEDSIFPQIEVRTFTPAERDEALAWASQPLATAEQEAEPAPPSVHAIATTRPDVIAFEISGRLRGGDMRRVIAMTDKALKAHEKLRVLLRVRDFDGIGLDALREEGLASIKMRGAKQIDRYALVGGPAWMQIVASWSAPLIATRIRYFEPEREDEAWRWLEAEPAPQGDTAPPSGGNGAG